MEHPTVPAFSGESKHLERVQGLTLLGSSGQTIPLFADPADIGPETAEGITAKITIPAGLTYLSDDSGGFFYADSGTWDVDTIANGANSTINLFLRANLTGSISAEIETASPQDPEEHTHMAMDL